MEIESDSDFKIMAEIKISSRRAISFRDCACEILRNIRQWKPNNFLLLYNKTVFFVRAHKSNVTAKEMCVQMMIEKNHTDVWILINDFKYPVCPEICTAESMDCRCDNCSKKNGWKMNCLLIGSYCSWWMWGSFLLLVHCWARDEGKRSRKYNDSTLHIYNDQASF